MSLSDLAARRTRQALAEGPQDARVHADVPASTEAVRVRLAGRGRSRYVETCDWVSNGRLPAAGDRAVVFETPEGMTAMVVATGPLITS